MEEAGSQQAGIGIKCAGHASVGPTLLTVRLNSDGGRNTEVSNPEEGGIHILFEKDIETIRMAISRKLSCTQKHTSSCQ